MALARRRSEPRVRRVARDGALQARARPVPADLQHAADAVADDHPRHQGRAARRSVRDVPRQARVDAAAEGGRAPRQRVRRFDPAADRRSDRRVEVRAQGSPGVPGPARPGRRLLPRASTPASRRRSRSRTRRRSCAGSRRSRARPTPITRRGSRKFTLSDKVPFLVTGASGSLGRRVVKRLRAEGHKRARVRAPHPGDSRIDGIEYAFGNLGDPVAVDRAVEGRRDRDPRRRRDEGRLARAQGRHRRRHAERDRRVQEAQA